MNAVIPENLDLQKHYTDYPPAQYISQFNPDHALYILSQITLVPIRNKTLADSLKDGFVPLYSVLLQRYVHQYKKYLTYFIDTGVIETDGKFWTAAHSGTRSKSTGYKFVEQHDRAITVTVEYTPVFRNLLVNRRKANYAALRKKYGHLTKWLHPECHLRVDEPTALRYLETRRDAQIRDPSLREKKKKTNWFSYLDDLQKDPVVQFKYARATVEVVQSGELGCTVDDNVGRMHTALTNMKAELRNLLTYRGEPMVSIDITSSQLYFTMVLFQPDFYTSKYSRKIGRDVLTLKIEDVSTLIQEELKQTYSDYSLMLVNTIQHIDNQLIEHYRLLVGKVDNNPSKSDVYEFMQEQSQQTASPLITRKDSKEGMFEILFGKDRNSPMRKLYKQLFPEVAKVYSLIKQGSHSRLARLLQSIESHVMLKIITKKIATQHPHIPMFTIHDSIAVPVQYGETVRAIMEAELTRITGLCPRLKMEYWKPESLDWEKYQAALQS